MKFDASRFQETLPYSSELFGVYQPLIGWKSRQFAIRLRHERLRVHNVIASRLARIQSGPTTHAPPAARASEHQITDLASAALIYPASTFDCCVARLLAASLKTAAPSGSAWRELASPAVLNVYLQRAQVAIIAHLENKTTREPEMTPYLERVHSGSFDDLMHKESNVAGYLQWLAVNAADMMGVVFYHSDRNDINEYLYLNDPLLNFGSVLMDAVLSPIGVIHLFRQYFFEFDNFLGTPVGHLWISPGGTVELVEVHSRKTFTERTFEAMLETTQRSETNSTNQDELSDAVRDENTNNTSFGFSATATYTVPTFQASATANLNLTNSRTSARESTHKHMRQQSEKLSSEIKKNFKSTFKTTQEVTDTSSKRYVIQNTTDRLVNYELRRKMRQIGVQVQDIGTQLCWQTFVEIPGATLGVAELVHIAEPADVTDVPESELIKPLPARVQHFTTDFIYQSLTNDYTSNDAATVYTNGDDGEGSGGPNSKWNNNHDTIVWNGSAPLSVPTGYAEIEAISASAAAGFDADISVSKSDPSGGTIDFSVTRVNFHGQSFITIEFIVHWKAVPLTIDQVNSNATLLSQNTTSKQRAKFEAFKKAANERIKMAGDIRVRPSEELREEERIIVYRSLVQRLMTVGWQSPHITSELIREIFDVDKMLYFVSPEWWRPQAHSKLTLGDKFTPGDEDLVSWGGPNGKRDDNYYITGESAPARMGSSLGWLLQLDGDTLRNAFLNSPWVKAVIPVRVGKEEAALHWLQKAQVEGHDGLDAIYQGSPAEVNEIKDSLKNPDGTLAHPQTVTILEAIRYLAQKIAEIDAVANTPAPFELDPEPDPTKKKQTMPTEVVYEHGFYPLQGGMKLSTEPLKVFTQWIEILPTDQVVALEYDPQLHL